MRAFIARVIVIVGVLLAPIVARAEVTISTPPGWIDARAPHEAVVRASAWAGDDAQVKTVLTPGEPDEFAETLAVLAIATPLDPDGLTDPERVRDVMLAAGRDRFGMTSEPQAIGRTALSNGVTAITGHWIEDDVVLRVALVPSAGTHVAIALAVAQQSDVLYADVLDEVLADLHGAAPPVRPVPRFWWVAAAFAIWIALGVAAFAIIGRTSVPAPGPATAGRRVAIGMLGAAIVVVAIVLVAVRDRAAALALAGVSPPWLALEIAGGGLLVAIVLWVATSIWENRIGVIQSAPSAGLYASRSSASWPMVELARSVEPIARLEAVGIPTREVDEPASLATAEIHLERSATSTSRGKRFHRDR